MNLPAFCIRRPAFTIVISLVMVIIGLIGFMNLPVRWIPNVTLPEVTIVTEYPGANARLVESDITSPIEAALAGVSGVESLTSKSKEGQSTIFISFKLGRNIDAAIEDVRSSIERIRAALPKDANAPIIAKDDPNNMPVLFIAFFDAHRTTRELSDYVEKFIIPSLETIDGVGSVLDYGKRISAVRVWLDPDKMAAARVTADDVTQLLQEQNAAIPSGQIKSFDRFYNVVTNSSLKTIEQFNELIIRNNQNQAVRLKDVGKIELGAEDTDSAFRFNGQPSIALGIIPQSIANPLDVEREVQKAFAELKKTLPAGIQAQIVYNQADYIRASIRSVYESFIEAVLFVWIIILIFLCNFRATFIPIVTIPVCLLSTFALLYFLGFSINTITLMALVLAIGLVVDDAIVMLENISRHREAGLSAFAAALKGSREIVFPIIAMTLTLTAVYAPIAFTPGLLGVLFREFTFTLAGAVLISGFVALTLSPMMCARILQHKRDGRYAVLLAKQLYKLQEFYRRVLLFLLQKRIWVLAALLVTGLIGFSIYRFLPSELAPNEDMNEMYAFVSAPRGASFQYTDSYVRQLEAIYNKIPEIDSYFTISMGSPSHSFQLLQLKPKKERKHSAQELVALLTSQANSLSGVEVNVSLPPPSLVQFVSTDEGDTIGLVVKTTNDYRQLEQTTQHLLDIIKQLPGFAHVDNGLKWDGQQFEVNIDRDRAADLNVPITNIANTMTTLLAGKIVGKTDYGDIIVQMNQSALADPNIIQQLYVRSRGGNMVPLTPLVNIRETTAPAVYDHFERLRSDTIYINLAPNLKLASAIKILQTIAQENLPDDVRYTFTGEAKSFLESKGKIIFTFCLAIIFIYLVLVAQFESFIDPLIILLTVPFAMVGAMLSLKIFGGSLNIYSNIGLITLVGLIAKHGILITEFANRLRAEGKSIQEAIVTASLLRLRPILMTTGAMVLGALPLAFAFGPGAESRQQIGLVISGGLLIGTFFSLVVVPIVYTYLAPFKKSHLMTSQSQLEYES